MNLVELSMKYRQVSFTIMFILLAVGIYALFNMPRSEDPEVKSNQALVVAFYPGASAEIVEEHVTQKIEDYLFTLKEIRRDKTYTTSENGRVVVNLELLASFPSSERETFWNKLQRGLSTLEMPEGVIGPVVNSEFGETVALMLAISSKRHSYAELEDYLEEMEDGLKTIPEVARIQTFGTQRERITLKLDSKKMALYQVSLNQITQSLQQQNQVQYSGDLTTGGTDIPLFTEGLYHTEDQIASQIVDYRPDGSTVRLKDVATVERGYEDPKEFIKMEDEKVLMLGIEMQPGKNVVKFGEQLEAKIEEIRTEHFPSDISVNQIYSQPHAVDHAISHFLREFAIAILAVILVVMILLPFRMATISAIASPLSIFITLAILYAMGIGLHSVSLAGMIVVLGMVVDDAIIIVDNYIEKLDEGIRPWEAAWKSATQLFIPVLTATLTIIFAFLPMNLMLNGIMGDYISAMPYTVAIALTTSFMVAIFITPYLCYLFIKKGLHQPQAAEKKQRKSFLDRVQGGYDRLVEVAFRRSALTLVIGVLAIVGGMIAMGKVAQEFSPKLERTVFNLEVWMPEGTSIERTEAVVDSVIAKIEHDERIENISSFVGTSSPRFFVTYAPEPPAENYAQLFVNVHTVDEAKELVAEYVENMENAIPGATIHVKQLSYQATTTPLEVRVIGEDLTAIRRVGDEIKGMLEEIPQANWVHTDFREDYYTVSVEVDQDEANRLGFSEASLAQTIGASLEGAPVTTYWEGDTPIDVVMRLEESTRDELKDIQNLYVSNPAGQVIPLRQVADFEPEWKPSRIVRRNGLRTLTVRAEAQKGLYASEMLDIIQPQIDELDLPPGVRIQYGGDYEASLEDMPKLMGSLGISIILIFITVLLQFKSLPRSLIILTTFPLSLLGGAMGLLITNNPFGFTAFIGLISLTGVVVRNGIVLVDYADELIRDHGYSVREAAISAAKRRMRPIFLTSSAAAIGVVPMILSVHPCGHLWGVYWQ